MAAATVSSMPSTTEPTEAQELPPHLTTASTQPSLVIKHYTAQDLPLPSATRKAYEALAEKFKKKGGFDDIRSQVWAKFVESVRHIDFQLPSIINLLTHLSFRTTKHK
jgi:hypothetical protein